MSTLLYITCNLKSAENSRSLTIGAEFLNEYIKSNPTDRIEMIDTYRDPIQRFDLDVLNGMDKLRNGMAFAALTRDEQIKLGKIWESADKFAAADKYVFVTPMWNLSFPPELKMYLDTVCVAGKTFIYSDKGTVGLLGGLGKKCLSIQASGGFHYGTRYDYSIPYLKVIMEFMGVDDFSAIVLEGVEAVPDRAEYFMGQAIEEAKIKATIF